MSEIKKFLLSEKICFSSLTAAFVMMLTFAFIKDPREFTISTIGLDHRVLFFFLCLLMAWAVLLNMYYFFDRVKLGGRGCRILTWIMCLGIVAAALTTTKRTEFETAVHWTGAMLFIACIPLVILYIGIRRIIRGEKKILIPVIFFHSVYCCDIGYMLVSFVRQGPHIGKNGIMEILPLGLTFIILLLANNTGLFMNQKKGRDSNE